MHLYNQYSSQGPANPKPSSSEQSLPAAQKPAADAFSTRAVTPWQPGESFIPMGLHPMASPYPSSPFSCPSLPEPQHNVAPILEKDPKKNKVLNDKVDLAVKYHSKNLARYKKIQATAPTCSEAQQQDPFYASVMSERKKLYEIELFDGKRYDPVILSNCLEYQKVYELLCLKIPSTDSLGERTAKYFFLHGSLAQAYYVHVQQFVNFIHNQLHNDYYPLHLLQDLRRVLSPFALFKNIITSTSKRHGQLSMQAGLRDSRIDALENAFQWGMYNWMHTHLYQVTRAVIRTHIKYVTYLYSMPCAEIRWSAENDLREMFSETHPFQVLLHAYDHYFNNDFKPLHRAKAKHAITHQHHEGADYLWQPFARALKDGDYAGAAKIAYQSGNPDWCAQHLLGDIMRGMIDMQLELISAPSGQITCSSLPVLETCITELNNTSDKHKVIFDHNPELENYRLQAMTKVRSRVSELEQEQFEQQSSQVPPKKSTVSDIEPERASLETANILSAKLSGELGESLLFRFWLPESESESESESVDDQELTELEATSNSGQQGPIPPPAQCTSFGGEEISSYTKQIFEILDTTKTQRRDMRFATLIPVLQKLAVCMDQHGKRYTQEASFLPTILLIGRETNHPDFSKDHLNIPFCILTDILTENTRVVELNNLLRLQWLFTIHIRQQLGLKAGSTIDHMLNKPKLFIRNR